MRAARGWTAGDADQIGGFMSAAGWDMPIRLGQWDPLGGLELPHSCSWAFQGGFQLLALGGIDSWPPLWHLFRRTEGWWPMVIPILGGSGLINDGGSLS